MIRAENQLNNEEDQSISVNLLKHHLDEMSMMQSQMDPHHDHNPPMNFGNLLPMSLKSRKICRAPKNVEKTAKTQTKKTEKKYFCKFLKGYNKKTGDPIHCNRHFTENGNL